MSPFFVHKKLQSRLLLLRGFFGSPFLFPQLDARTCYPVKYKVNQENHQPKTHRENRQEHQKAQILLKCKHCRLI